MSRTSSRDDDDDDGLISYGRGLLRGFSCMRRSAAQTVSENRQRNTILEITVERVYEICHLQGC